MSSADRPAQPERSECCGAPLLVSGAPGITPWYVCEECLKPCNSVPSLESRLMAIGDQITPEDVARLPGDVTYAPAPVERDTVRAPADAPGSRRIDKPPLGGTPPARSIPVEREEGMWERACESVDAAMAESEHMWVLKMLYFARAEVVRELRSAIRTIDRRLFPVTKTMDEVSCVVAWLERHTEAIEKGEGGA